MFMCKKAIKIIHEHFELCQEPKHVEHRPGTLKGLAA